jgi:NAD dependent epimerase/dehydratase
MNMDEFWQDKRVLVTGAGGFIGSHVVETLLQKGARVRGFVHYNSRGDNGLLSMLPQEHSERLEIVAGDLRDLSAVQAASKEIEVILHLGALIAIPYSYVHPAEVVETNIIGTLNVLMAGRDNGVGRIVHTSTSEVYGTAIHTPIREDHPLQGQSPYSASKIGADKLAESFYRAYNLPVVTLRPFNTYGPRQSARAVIPTIITQAITRSTIHLGNVDARRDFTYVSDTVAGFLCAGQVAGIEGDTFNLGVGSEITIGNLVEEILSILDIDVKVVVETQRLRPEKSEVKQLISDNSQARKCLGWEPKVSLHTGLSQTIVWIKENIQRYRPQEYAV